MTPVRFEPEALDELDAIINAAEDGAKETKEGKS